MATREVTRGQIGTADRDAARDDKSGCGPGWRPHIKQAAGNPGGLFGGTLIRVLCSRVIPR